MNTRWKITGTFTLLSPMHVGSGDITTRPRLNVGDEPDVKPGVVKCEVQAIVIGHAGRPCIPGTALKGVLRSWAEDFYTGSPHLVRVFGTPDADAKGAHAGWADFLNCFAEAPSANDLTRLAKHVAWWDASRLAGVYSSVCLDRHTGAARANKLFFQEFVPEGIRFPVEIDATRLTEDEVAWLLGLLHHGAAHSTHPLQFGANGGDGWGRVEWKLGEVRRCTNAAAFAGVGFACCVEPWTPPALPAPAAAPVHVALDMELRFSGPFLVNDASREKDDDHLERTNFTALACADGSAWLPSSSFRGALRQHAERLLRTLDPSASGDPNGPIGKGPIERLFGSTGQASRLMIGPFREEGRAARRHQDFVAIDRFTGGAAEGAKFDATYAARPTFKGRLILDTKGLEAVDLALVALTLRDLTTGQLSFGFGGSKGYGHAEATITSGGQPFDPASWGKPQGQASPLAALLVKQAIPDSTPTVAALAAPSARKGTLVKEATKKGHSLKLEFSNERGEAKALLTVPMDLFGPGLRAGLDKLPVGRLEVEYDWKSGKHANIRLPGTGSADPSVVGVSPTHFANPYYFLPMMDRAAFKDGLADQAPVGHERLMPGRFSGTLSVKLTVETPLLLVDRGTPNGDGHTTHGVLMDGDRPLLASSSVRGMLRSAYEAITNSRFGVFPGSLAKDGEPATGNGKRLGLRLRARSALDAVPVRIENGPNGLQARLLNGTSPISKDGKLASGPQFAAWVGTYRWTPRGRATVGHRDRVRAWVTPWKHQRNFTFWNVEELLIGGTNPVGPPSGPVRPVGQRSGPDSWASPQWVEGWLCDNGRNMSNKHDERLFFDLGTPDYATLGSEAIEQWRELIADYRAIHVDETGPSAMPGCVFSRHITAPRNEEVLQDGDLAYAVLGKQGSGWSVKELYPVMISRKLHARSPLEALPPSLQPAKTLVELSPADRVFGWVSQQSGKRDDVPAYRGQVAIGPVECTDDNAVEPVGGPEGLPLAILGQPKPHQGRFYAGNSQGRAQVEGGTKADRGYNGRLRGPKAYPHHRDLANDHWSAEPEDDGTAAPGRFREHLRYGGERDSQNRSIRGWVRKGTLFTFQLRVTNLSRIELGALAWLLGLPEGHFLRLGLGKPLGFGSVRAELDGDPRIAEGTEWAAGLAAWGDRPALIDLTALATMASEFEAAITAANPEILPTFRRVAEGLPGLAVHYPRGTAEPQDSQAIYEWFGENEEGGKLSLLDVIDSQPGLPRNPR